MIVNDGCDKVLSDCSQLFVLFRKRQGEGEINIIVGRVVFLGSLVVNYSKWTFSYAQLKFNCSLTLFLLPRLHLSFLNEENGAGVYETLPRQPPI